VSKGVVVEVSERVPFLLLVAMVGFLACLWWCRAVAAAGKRGARR
jgi:hypothetical protein